MTYLEPVSPYSTQRRRYKPEIGHTITVDLPGERIRAEIKGVANEDAVVCRVLGTPIAKTPHGVAKDDTICVRRDTNSIGMECWTMITDREMQQREQAAKFEEAERAKGAKVDAARIAKLHKDSLAAQEAAMVPPAKAKKKPAVRGRAARKRA